MRGIIIESSSDSNSLGKNMSFMTVRYDFGGDIPINPLKSRFAIQYFVEYKSLSRSIWKHSENAPNSNMLPSKNPDGIFPQASKTEFHNEYKTR